MSGSHWTACQVFSKRLPRIRAAFEESGRGTFTPVYTKRWYTDGKPSERQQPLLPGYLLVKVGDDWGELTTDEMKRLGVIRVLSNDGRASLIQPDEMARLTLGHAQGAWNEIERPAEPERRRRRRRRPRPGRRWRALRGAA